MINENDIDPIKEKISQYRGISEQVKNWLVNETVIRRLCQGIGERYSRDQFLEIITSQLNATPEDQDRFDVDDMYRSFQLALNNYELSDGSIISLTRGRRGGMSLENRAPELNKEDIKIYEDAQKQSDNKERELYIAS